MPLTPGEEVGHRDEPAVDEDAGSDQGKKDADQFAPAESDDVARLPPKTMTPSAIATAHSFTMVKISS
jgi:hypothetical protein